MGITNTVSARCSSDSHSYRRHHKSLNSFLHSWKVAANFQQCFKQLIPIKRRFPLSKEQFLLHLSQCHHCFCSLSDTLLLSRLFHSLLNLPPYILLSPARSQLTPHSRLGFLVAVLRRHRASAGPLAALFCDF